MKNCGNIFNTMFIHPPRHLVWSTDTINLRDPFQKRWLLRQTLTHGRAEDIHALDLVDIKRELDQLGLPNEIESLWRRYLEHSNAKSESN
ncbi:MAG: hypothetical protein ACYC6R_16470 [Anaerolineales bacterium]